MVDSLQELIDARDEIIRDTGSNPTEASVFIQYDALHSKLDSVSAYYRHLVSLFSSNFVETICPRGSDPSNTWFYKEVAEAESNPGDLYSRKVMAFVRATQEIIQFFDRTHIKNTVKVSQVLRSIKLSVEDTLSGIYASVVQASPQELDSLSNLERFSGSLNLLNYNLNLHELNDWIRNIQPVEPFAMSIHVLQQQLDPSTAREAGQEFMELLLELSQIINPFDVEIAANEMLTGWKYLHTP